MISRIVFPVYGLLCYAVFFATFLYTVAFVANFQPTLFGHCLVPHVIDAGGADLPVGTALAVNLGLLGLFAVQHSGMARRGFKAFWTRVLVPKAVERSTYVLFASLCLIALLAWWAPMKQVLWAVPGEIGRSIMLAISMSGWGLAFVATFLINHFELFGLRQVWLHARRRTPAEPTFRLPALYRLVRHPLYLGFIIAFWAAPVMTVGHLLFAAVTLGYILVAITLEERDLVDQFGDRYQLYQQRVHKLLPLPKSGAAALVDGARRA